MIFVDTGAWFASIVPWDANHAAAREWLSQNQDSLLTTNYVLDETLTLLRTRKERDCALTLGVEVFAQRLARLYFLQEPDLRAAWTLFRTFSDKDWSFTDCTSRVAIERLGLTTAFAFDRHFRQFGIVKVVP